MLQRLAELPHATEAWPTHGAGSFRAAPPGAARTSTTRREKQANPLRNAGSEQAFVDVRPVEQCAANHVTGALSIPLRGVFATWLGWAVDADQLVVVVRDDDQDPDEIVWQAAEIGYDVAGDGHVPGAVSVELGRLAEGDRPTVADGVAVMCGHGERAMTAVSLVEQAGVCDLAVVVGGPEAWAAHSGQPLQIAP